MNESEIDTRIENLGILERMLRDAAGQASLCGDDDAYNRLHAIIDSVLIDLEGMYVDD